MDVKMPIVKIDFRISTFHFYIPKFRFRHFNFYLIFVVMQQNKKRKRGVL